MDKLMKRYKMIQIDEETHAVLKEFCEERGYKISGLIRSLVKEKIRSSKKVASKNVLPTKT